MSVTVTYEEHSLEGPTRLVRRYLVKGSLLIDDIATALFIDVNCPFRYGFWLRLWDQKVLHDVGGGAWKCEVPYGVGDYPHLSIPSLGGSSGGTTDGGRPGGGYTLPGDDVALGPEWSIDFSQGSALKTKSIRTKGGYSLSTIGGVQIPVQILPNEDGDVIGYDFISGEVKGVEVPVGIQRVEYTFKIPQLTLSYMRRLRDLSSPPNTNTEAFAGFAAGEVKFVGGNVSFTYANGVSVRLFLDVGKTQEVIVSADLPPVTVRPWQYLDVAYMPMRDSDSPTGYSKQVLQYVVHDVLPDADFNDLFT
jgi:hypothetical protein